MKAPVALLGTFTVLSTAHGFIVRPKVIRSRSGGVERTCSACSRRQAKGQPAIKRERPAERQFISILSVGLCLNPKGVSVG